MNPLLIGGWGYGNLGDEVILASYLLDSSAKGISMSVASINPKLTRRALFGHQYLQSHKILDESVISLRASLGGKRSSSIVLAGGGYLNGTWTTEIGGKLRRIEALSVTQSVAMHASEVHRIEKSSSAEVLRSILDPDRVFVRDDASRRALMDLGLRSEILPDAISLLVPHLHSLTVDLPSLRDITVVNLLDITERNDRDEASFHTSDWVRDCRELIARLGNTVIGLAIDDADALFMTKSLGLTVLQPTTVVGLTSILASAKGVVSTRMHPALIALIAGTPTIALPYCAKVDTTLANLGLEGYCLKSAAVFDARPVRPDNEMTNRWWDNYVTSSSALYERVLKR